MKKKAQIMGQVFVYIIAAVTFAMILIFGYNAIQKFLDKGETVEFYTFKSSLESSVKELYSQKGSARVKTFHVPGDYREVCFVNMEKDNPPDGNVFCSNHGIVCDAWKTAKETDAPTKNADANVFLDPLSPVPLKVYNIDPSGGDTEGVLCFEINGGSFEVKLEGMGDRVVISSMK